MALFGKKSGRKDYEKLPFATRAVTFYAEDGGSWPHFEPIVRELTERQGRTIAYLTSSAADPVLTLADPRIAAFEIGEGAGRSFLFSSMEAGVVVATVPRLGIPVLPRSKRAAALGMQYVYVFHSMASTHMIYDADGFDRFDTVLCVGPYMVDEIRAREAQAGLPAKELLEHGYGRLDTIMTAAAAAPAHEPNDPPVVLVAPSWGPTCLFESCGAEVVGALLDGGFEVIARPHPMTDKRTPKAIPELRARFDGHERFSFDGDVASRDSLARADVMVSDWSGAALEYAFGRERPVVFVDVPRKVNNPDYEQLGIEPFEVSVRERIGRVVAPGDGPALCRAVEAMTSDVAGYRERIVAARAESVWNLGASARVAADVIGAKADAFLAGRR